MIKRVVVPERCLDQIWPTLYAVWLPIVKRQMAEKAAEKREEGSYVTTRYQRPTDKSATTGNGAQRCQGAD